MILDPITFIILRIKSLCLLVLDTFLLKPFELYESIAIVPVSFLRRHIPFVGGTLVVFMTLNAILIRVGLRVLHGLIDRVTFNSDPVLNYQIFWGTIRDRYAIESKRINWSLAYELFADKMSTSTSEEDLWIAMQDSILMTDDPMLTIARTSLGLSPNNAIIFTASGKKVSYYPFKLDEELLFHRMIHFHLKNQGRQIANDQILFGILNATTCPGWRIGYIGLMGMEGFVDLPLPRIERPEASQLCRRRRNPVIVPRVFDIESMRWALDAILRTLGSVDGLILDLRLNQGGGNVSSALAVASFFTQSCTEHPIVFSIKKKQALGPIFTKSKDFRVPRNPYRSTYTGPLVILQSKHTRGTAELLCLALKWRPNTYRIGSLTAGCLSQVYTVRLPNAWTLKIPNQQCQSPDGTLYEGRGIPPDEEILPEAISTSSMQHMNRFDPYIRAAMELVFAKCLTQ
uniref:Uncharacterized protein AlNc14C6G908 n=1 Tax=Albugo laibachii Nc14 TaxID=890382 RepID=F0W1D9_9STRA|nr:conserved hypothetical protein [Albugo laibachii Nc14]|eukprot:CCA14867.1 conserved hypothetical protein [Albugo laibachii Nc14]